MAVQKAIDNLKERPKDEKTAVAGGIAIGVVAILLVIWGIYFLHQLRSGAVAPSFQGAGQQFNSGSLQQAQSALQNENSSSTSQFSDLPNQTAQQQVGTQAQLQSQQQQGGTDQFGNPSASY